MKHLKKFENYNNVEVSKSGGLKCDNQSCGWIDPSIKVEDYKDWVNKPCPECGENLLTEEDFDSTNRLMDAINMINSMSPDQLKDITKNMDADDMIDAYLKLKELGVNQKEEGSSEWTIDPSKLGGK